MPLLSMRSIAHKTNIKYLSILVCYAALMWLLFNFQALSFRIYEQLNSNSIILDPYLDFSKGLILSVIFALIFLQRKTYLFLWLIKAFVTLFLLLPYEFYYGLDSFTYFNWAVDFDLQTIEGYWGTHGTTRLIVFVHYLTYIFGDSYYAIKIFFSFLGFIGLVIFYEAYKYINYKNNIFVLNDKFIYVLFLFPSIIFWSSTLGKDPLNLFFVSIFFFSFIQIMSGRITIRNALLIVFSLISMFYLRPWWVVIMVGSIVMYYLFKPSKQSIIILIVFVPVLYYFAQFTLEYRGINSYEEIFHEITILSYNMTDMANSKLNPLIVNNLTDYIVQYIPNLFTAIYRPMAWDVSNSFTLIAAFENSILLLLSFKYIFFKFKSILQNKFLLYLLIFIASWSVFYTILSTGNLGVATRFKLQILPLILILISVSYHSRHHEYKNKLNYE